MYIIASDNGARCRKTVPGTVRYAGSLVPLTYTRMLDGGRVGAEKVLFWVFPMLINAMCKFPETPPTATQFVRRARAAAAHGMGKARRVRFQLLLSTHFCLQIRAFVLSWQEMKP